MNDRGIAQRPLPENTSISLPDTLHPVLRRVYAARRVVAAEIEPSLRGMIPVSQLDTALTAAARLAEARRDNEHVMILGDFDADGATGTALMISTLRAFGFKNLSYLVPDRFEYGYGLSPAIVDLAAERNPDLIVTVDNGVSSVDGVERAHEKGIEVLVTDHHLPGSTIPAADIIVNPNMPGNTFPSKALSGVGVAFYVVAALQKVLAADGDYPESEGRALVAGALDLVALGTVADLVPLDFNNRSLVNEGLRRMRAGRTRPGILALFRVANRNIRDATANDLGYAIAPRVNAAGRLTDMSLGIECLLSTTAEHADELAAKLNLLNSERRELQTRMEGEAQQHIDAAAAAIEQAGDAAAHCLFDERWHEGVVGLVAGRLKDRVMRPVVAFAQSGQAGELKGSARSVGGIHIRDVLDAVATRLPDDVKKFGGHAMAAGLSLNSDGLERFRAAFVEEVERFRHILDAPDFIWTDGPLGPSELRLDFAEEIRRAGPWGQGFPEPLFDNRLEIVDQKLLQDKHLKLRVRHPDGGAITDAIAFNYHRLLAEGGDESARFLYRLDVNEFRNRRSAQLVVEHIR